MGTLVAVSAWNAKTSIECVTIEFALDYINSKLYISVKRMPYFIAVIFPQV